MHFQRQPSIGPRFEGITFMADICSSTFSTIQLYLFEDLAAKKTEMKTCTLAKRSIVIQFKNQKHSCSHHKALFKGPK